MIQISLKRDDKKREIRVVVKYHADKIICSAASMLIYTLGQIIHTLDELGKLDKKPTLKLESGDAKIVASADQANWLAVAEAFMYTLVGLQLLEHTYPDQVKLDVHLLTE